MNAAAADRTGAAPGRRLETAVVLLLCALVGAFYLWTVRSSGDAWKFGREQNDYYNLLIDGYLEGQLHMKVEVPEALRKLENPYDPALRPPGLGLHDASYYQGRYYVYFGVAPMVVLMLPFRILTGTDLPLAVATLVFVYGGFLAATALLVAARRRYFPEVGTWVLAAGIVALGLAGVHAVLLRRPHMWELPIGGGMCFALLALGAVWRALHADARRWRWFGAAGLLLGLAIAARPTYLVAGAFLLVPVLVWWRAERRFPAREFLFALGPLLAIGAAMAWHNHARFGNPLEFGQAYQFSLDYESKLPHFRVAYLPYTGFAHFFAPAEWTPYFPFIRRADLGPAPTGYAIHRGDVFGALAHFPILWLAFASPLALWRRDAAARQRLGTWLATAAVLFGLAALLLCLFFGALARYQLDFLPALQLLAAVGLLALVRWRDARCGPEAKAVVAAGLIAATAASAAFGILFSLQVDGVLAERNPRLAADVARLLNRIPATWETWRGVRHGPAEFTLRLPPRPEPGQAVLISAGVGQEADRLFLRTLPDGKVQLGLAPAGRPEIASRPLALAANAPHRVRATWGALFPPSTHPFFAGWDAADVVALTRRVRIEVDGETVVAGYQRSRDTQAGAVKVGADALAGAAWPRFGGTISNVRREPAAAARPLAFARLRRPFDRMPSEAGTPLVALGEGSAAPVLAVRGADADRVQLVLAAPGAAELRSGVLALPPGGAGELTLQAESGTAAGRTRWLVHLDGDLVWAPELEVPAAVPVLRRAFGAAGFEAVAGGDPMLQPGNAVRLHLRRPAGRSGEREPLLVTGRSGAGDIVLIEYRDEMTVRFAYDHWGSPMRFSPPVRLEAGRTATVEMALPSLATVPDATQVREVHFDRLEVAVDGAAVWTEPADVYVAEHAEVAVGRNPIGGTSGGPRFTGELLRAERVRRE
jgi:hypothetical protein